MGDVKNNRRGKSGTLQRVLRSDRLRRLLHRVLRIIAALLSFFLSRFSLFVCRGSIEKFSLGMKWKDGQTILIIRCKLLYVTLMHFRWDETTLSQSHYTVAKLAKCISSVRGLLPRDKRISLRPRVEFFNRPVEINGSATTESSEQAGCSDKSGCSWRLTILPRARRTRENARYLSAER